MPEFAASIPRPEGSGFALGEGVFEAVKIVAGEPFALQRHLDRLLGSAEALGVGRVESSLVQGEVDLALGQAPLTGLSRLRITLTQGVDAVMVTVVVAPMAPAPLEAAVVTCPWPRHERGATVGHKSTDYVDDILALRMARARGAAEVVYANTAGQVCEGPTSNLFYVMDGELRTPTLGSGCLPGVTRALVLEWYGAVELDDPIEILQRCDEIFVVSTTRDVQPVTRCDDRVLSPGPVTADVSATWRRRAPELLEGQTTDLS